MRFFFVCASRMKTTHAPLMNNCLFFRLLEFNQTLFLISVIYHFLLLYLSCVIVSERKMFLFLCWVLAWIQPILWFNMNRVILFRWRKRQSYGMVVRLILFFSCFIAMYNRTYWNWFKLGISQCWLSEIGRHKWLNVHIECDKNQNNNKIFNNQHKIGFILCGRARWLCDNLSNVVELYVLNCLLTFASTTCFVMTC